MNWNFLLIFQLFFVNIVGLMAQNNTDYPDFERHQYISSKGVRLPYRLLKPLHYDSTQTYPLVLGLHGAGARGTDNEINLKNTSIAFRDSLSRIQYPCFMFVPQCPQNEQWVNVPWGADAHQFPQKPSKYLEATMELLDSLTESYAIDTNCLYIVGLSMGGFGVWDAIARYPDKFAAAIPVCGGGDESTASSIKHIAIWAFHGADDATVKPSRTQNMITALQKAGAKPRYTLYKNVGHASWKNAFEEPALLKWLFSQSKK